MHRCLFNKTPSTRRSRRKGRRLSNRRYRRVLKKTQQKELPAKPWQVVKGRRICAADQINRDLTICCKGERFYDSSQNRQIANLCRLPTTYKGYQKLGIYSSNTLCTVRSRFIGRCFNKASRFFGINPKKDRHWAALLRAVVCCGLNATDFRSLMRIRDLKIRGRKTTYRKAVTGFIARLPKVHVKRALNLSFEERL